MSIQFNMNTQKAVEAVLWIIQNGESNMYNVWKILFSAEKYHLNTYGSPITGDTYVAMKYGTVPRWLYDATGMEQSKIGFHRQDKFLFAERDPLMRYLSESNVEALKLGFKEYAGLDFNLVEEKNHKEPAWIKNYKGYGSTPIPFEDFIDEDWLKEDLELIAESMVL